jgi:hypothetical protein
MVNRNLIRGLDYEDELMEQELNESFGDLHPEDWGAVSSNVDAQSDR